ncbi:uncharacterized protein LOC126376367 [Pectinophora gossypiella]|uniref:uncharacterized protein LOC126369169 n=1 Tax=Pectinophora gossypiella TaxID=13191 RepID=UPI00214EE596|nr:uncharacterized protein LOC126369169 [Pectinophora gossypiella]XP_049879647.1 uncharacterized protein LOC126376367 [Pectinophora gossypiella]
MDNLKTNAVDASKLKKIGRGDGTGDFKSAQAQQHTGLHADTKFAGHTVAQPGSTTPEALQRPGQGACAARPCKGIDEGGDDFGRPIPSGRDRVPEIERERRLSVVLTRCDTPIAAKTASREEESMDSDDDSSSASMITVGSEVSGPRRLFLKRNRSDPEAEESDSPGSLLEGAGHRSKRGRGRPSSTGKYVGLAAARAAYNQELAESLRLEAEAEVAGMARNLREARASLQPSPHLAAQEEDAEQTSAALASVVKASLETITMVATKSSQLKGTYVRALKDAVRGIQEAVSQIRERTMSEEVMRLEAANSKLTREVADLRRDLQELRQRPSQPQSSESSLRQILEETARANAEMFGNMLNARLAGIEDRLLPEPRRRPPLAADVRGAKADPAHPEPAGAPAASTSGSGRPMAGPGVKPKPAKEAPTNSQASSAPPSSGKKGKSKKKSLAAQEAAEARRQPASTPAMEPWTAVVGRKAKNKAAKAAKAAKEPQKPRPTAQKRAKLRTPRTAAVSLTLVPGVEERGVTYASILSDAKRRVSLADLGINNMRFRRAATGARLLEIGGEDSAAKADSLAKKLREVLSPDAVKVVRPVKRAEIRVTGLDDSADAIEVADAVAKEGGCAVDDVKHGRIVVGPRGDGSLWVSCPVAAAKRLSDSGRLLVGWTSARVRLLDPRPARCYRCLEPGHLGAKCSCEVDRSRLCFRCGQPDHQARDCTAEPHCPVCATAGKPAAHSIGGSGCISAATKPAAKSPKKGARKPKRPKRKAKRAGAEQMDTVP